MIRLILVKKGGFMRLWHQFLHMWNLAQPKQVIAAKTASHHVEEAIEKVIRDLQKRGFLQLMPGQQAHEPFSAVLKALDINSCFTFHVVDRTQGSLELHVFHQDGTLVRHAVDASCPFDHDAFLQQHAPSGIPVSQLQDVSGWLQKHNWQAASPLLDKSAIEKKLEGLMKSCPHGAYVMHTHDKTLTLSRLSPGGKIEHMIINLQKRLGSYSLEVDGKAIAATSAEFKKRLQQMGKPIRLVPK